MSRSAHSSLSQRVFQAAAWVLLAGALCALAPSSARADYRDIAWLEQMHASMVHWEDHLLNQRREITQALAAQADGTALLVEHADGRITAVPRSDLRDMVGMVYDAAQYIAITENILPFLPEEVRDLLDPGSFAGVGRVMAVDRGIALLEARQPALRRRLSDRLRGIDDMLETVRSIAAEVLAERDALKRQRTQEGIIDGSVCFHDTAPMDGWATVASIGYGGGKYPVKGRFICIGFASFLWDSGVSIREFRCSDRNARPPVCSLFSEMAYERDTDPDTGHTIYRLEDRRTTISFHFR